MLAISTVAGAALAHPDFPFNLPGRNACRHLSRARYAVDSGESTNFYARVARMMEVQKSRERVARWRDFVAEQLGREPRGFRDVAAFWMHAHVFCMKFTSRQRILDEFYKNWKKLYDWRTSWYYWTS